jgi:hypothetical protein
MRATAKHSFDVWQGEHRAGFAKIIIDLQSLDSALNGMGMREAWANSKPPSPAIPVPIVSPRLNGVTLTFVATNSPTNEGHLTDE